MLAEHLGPALIDPGRNTRRHGVFRAQECEGGLLSGRRLAQEWPNDFGRGS